MHWFQALDTGLFHFINGALANPFFDWLMPVLSGQGVPWLPAVIVATPLALIFGSARLRICVVLMVLTVSLGDPLIVGSLKDAVSRPRPYVVLHDARLFGQTGAGYVAPLADGKLPASANTHSFPSAHAANWFAMATIALVFYRRKAWFMVPLAAAVAFSRVYNGVHYPSDVAGGAGLGAAYALAFLWLLQMAWSVVGKRVFPAWHARLPNLLRPEPHQEPVGADVRRLKLCSPETQMEPPHVGAYNLGIQCANASGKSLPVAWADDREWLRLGYLVIFLALLGRWIYIASGVIGLSEDEAYQWLWSKHLALSYYSKPPGIALIQWAGTSLFGDNEFGVRFFSPVFAALLSVLVLRFMAREIGARAAFCLLLITFATPLLVVGSVLMTIDPPLVLCWMWAVVAGWRAAQPAGRTRDWFVVGAALGLGFLCKYTAMLQIVCWALFFALQPPARIHLRKPGPWLALLVFGICTLPVIVWNAGHHWITASDVAGDAGLHSAWQPTLNYFFEFIGAEAGLLNPVFFIGALWAVAGAWKQRREKPLWLFLLCMGAPLFFGYWLLSFHSRVQPNWIAAAVPPMFCLMAAYWAERWAEAGPRVRPRVIGWLVAGLVIGVGASVFMYSSDLVGKLAGRKLPGDVDPSHRTRGWRETALAVEAERLRFDTNAFILADHYGTAGLYSFYSPPARAAAESPQPPLVYCLDSDKPINQFPFWDEYNYREHRQGQNALFVLRLEPYKLERGWIWQWLRGERIEFRDPPAPLPAPGRVADEFESVTNLGVREIRLSDARVFQRVELFGCYDLK
jgi:membrane-associated phospholipid phosphatase